MLTLADVRAAAGRIAASVVRTPILRADPIDRATGAHVTMKLETFQATGAFKERGAANRLALGLGLVVAAVPIAVVLVRWLPERLRWAREAGAAARLRSGSPDLELFAVRALAHRPLVELARLGPDPAGADRRNEPGAVEALAGLELTALGLRAPPAAGGGQLRS